VPTTVGRPRGRQGVHSGAAGDHTGKIVTVSTTAIVVIVAVLALTKVGHVIDAATQHFMLYYAGVLALVGLTGSVLLGLVATDRIVMTPGHRVMAQAVHRAFSFGTLVFLIIHITTEILAQRSHALDAVVPFLSPYRTFYIGLGTIASDLILLLVITSVLRRRFTANGSAWRWRAMHYSSYAAFVFGVLHGLLGGRAAKPYVDWSYGFAIAVTAFGLAVRFLAVSLRPKESLSSSPSVDRAGAASSSPMRAAATAMAMAQVQLGGAQLGGATRVLPAGLGAGGLGADGAAGAATWTATALPAPGRSPFSGPLPALGPGPGAYGPIPAYAGSSPVPDAYGPVPDAYSDLGFTPLGAPPYGDDAQHGMRARPYMPAGQLRPALSGPARQPRYEPGYDGPPRFEGAPRGLGDVPHDELSSYPYGPRGRRAKPVSPYPEEYRDRSVTDGRTAPRPGPMEPAPPRAAITAPPRPGDRSSGPQPQLGSGPMPRPDTGPMPRAGGGPMPRVDTGPMPRPDTGPMPRAGGGQPPRHGTGPVPRVGQVPRTGTGPMPRADSGPPSWPGTGPMPRPDTGPMPRVDTGPMPRPDTGPMPRAGGGQPPRHGADPAPRTGRGRAPRADTGSMPRLDTGPMPRLGGTGPMPRPDTGPVPATGSMKATGSGPRHGRPVPESATGPRTGSPPRPATRPSHRAKPTDPRYRDRPGPGPTGGNEWE
jgi:hypothetical protein